MSLKESVLKNLQEYTEDAQNEVCAEGASKTRANPLPDVGTYETVFNDLDTFITESDEGVSFLNVCLRFQVIDGANKNRLIERAFWGNNPYDQAALQDFTTILTGDKPQDSTTKGCVLALGEAFGTKARLRIYTYNSKKKGAVKAVAIQG